MKHALETRKINCLIIFLIAFQLLLSSCAPATPSPIPTLTEMLVTTVTSTEEATSTATSTPTTQPTLKITSSPTVTSTPEPIYVTLGSPFAADCGYGVPIVRANSAFNGVDNVECIDSEHGHSDFWVPNGCIIDEYTGEFIAPIQGELITNPGGYTLNIPSNTLVGIENALQFAGIPNPDIRLINSVRLELGHIEPLRLGYFEKGESIGDVITINPSGYKNQYMIAYWVGVVYEGKGYALSPTLFLEDPDYWPCIDGITLPNQCEAIPNNYPDSCN